MNRYIKVKALLTNEPARADYEELAFADADLMDRIRTLVRNSGHVRCLDFEDRGPQWKKDMEDLIFYHVAHVVNAYTDEDSQPSEELIDTIIDAVGYTVTSLMTTTEFLKPDA